MNIRRLLLFVAGILVPQGVVAESSEPIFIGKDEASGLIQYVKLIVDDQISDACWTNSDRIISRIRLMFEQNEIPVIDYVPAFYDGKTVLVFVRGLGLREGNDRCVSVSEFSVKSFAYQELGGWGDAAEYSVEYSAEIFSASSIFTSGSNNDEQIFEFVEASASDLISDIISSRRAESVRKYHSDFPISEELPMTREAWNALFKIEP